MSGPVGVVALVGFVGAVTGLSMIAAHGQTLSGDALVKSLRQGGHVLVMRHASSPREVPDKQTANADNVKLERQLDEGGRRGSTAMGQALRKLNIPIGEALTSPTYRALETVRLAQLSSPQPYVEPGDGGQSMQGVSEAQGVWLRERAMCLPRGTNTMIVTHSRTLRVRFRIGAPWQTARSSLWVQTKRVGRVRLVESRSRNGPNCADVISVRIALSLLDPIRASGR